jgi:hypothetical protein
MTTGRIQLSLVHPLPQEKPDAADILIHSSFNSEANNQLDHT